MTSSELTAEQKCMIKEYIESELNQKRGLPTLNSIVTKEKKNRARGVRSEKNDELQKEYLKARSDGETAYVDKRGYTRQMTYNQWIKKNKAPSYNEEDGSFNIPTADLYDTRTLIMKTLGSRVSKKVGSEKNKYLQTGITYYLKMLEAGERETLPELLKDKKFVDESVNTIAQYIELLCNGGGKSVEPARRVKSGDVSSKRIFPKRDVDYEEDE